jgi:hypothetical protein
MQLPCWEMDRAKILLNCGNQDQIQEIYFHPLTPEAGHTIFMEVLPTL